jgi:ABC-type phosphate transport system substrate-binding protein
MRRSANASLLFGVGLSLLVGVASIVSFQPHAASQPSLRLVVIANASVPEKMLDVDALRMIFLRKRLAWSSGQNVVAINQPPGSPARLAFDTTVLGFDEDRAARYWIDARIRSGTQPPATAPTDAMMLRFVTTLAGSIGYVAAEHVSPDQRIVARIEAGRVVRP